MDRTITFGELEALITELAKKYKDDHKLQDEDTAKQQITQKLTKTKPKTHGTTVCLSVRYTSGVVRICCEEGQRLKLCHGALTVDFRAGCSSGLMTNGFVANAVLVERAVSC